MKGFLSLLALLGCLFAANAIADTSIALNHFNNHALPVLVHVNAEGQVTQVQPSRQLSPRVDRMLRRDLDRMITSPAVVQGHAVSSQFVINLAVKATPRGDGKYDAHFVYVSSVPVPGGGWYWSHSYGRQLALVANHSTHVDRRRYLRLLHNHQFVPVRHDWSPASTSKSTSVSNVSARAVEKSSMSAQPMNASRPSPVSR